jgi:hypothetical protein
MGDLNIQGKFSDHGYISTGLKKILLIDAPKTKRCAINDINPYCASASYLKNALLETFKGVDFKDFGFFQFKNVGMHTDAVTRINHYCVIFMLKGGGELSYFKNRKDFLKKEVTERVLYSGDYVVFDDRLPHAFVSDKVCTALICSANKKYFDLNSEN